MKRLLILLLLLLTGCFDYNDTSITLLISSLGIDYIVEEDTYEFYYHLINPSSLTTSEMGGGSEENSFSIAKVKNKSFYEALQVLSINSNEKVSLSHLQSMILTDSFFSIENLNLLLQIIRSSPWVYPEFKILVTTSKLQDIYMIQNAENISPYFSMIGEFDTDKNYIYTFYSHFAMSLSEPHYTTHFTIIDSTKDLWQKEKDQIISLFYDGIAYINKKGDSILIKKDEYPIINLLSRKEGVTLTYDDINFRISNSKISVKLKGNNVVITAAGLSQVTNSISTKKNEYQDLFNEKVKESLEQLVMLGINNNIDIFNVNDLLYRYKKIDSMDYTTATYIYDISYDFIY